MISKKTITTVLATLIIAGSLSTTLGLLSVQASSPASSTVQEEADNADVSRDNADSKRDYALKKSLLTQRMIVNAKVYSGLKDTASKQRLAVQQAKLKAMLADIETATLQQIQEYNPNINITLSRGVPVKATNADIFLLAKLINSEAGDEPYACKLGVGNVVLNRMREYDQTLLDVIFAPSQFDGTLTDNFKEIPPDECIKAAREVYSGVQAVPTDTLYFVNLYLASPEWARTNNYVMRLGDTWFFREPDFTTASTQMIFQKVPTPSTVPLLPTPPNKTAPVAKPAVKPATTTKPSTSTTDKPKQSTTKVTKPSTSTPTDTKSSSSPDKDSDKDTTPSKPSTSTNTSTDKDTNTNKDTNTDNDSKDTTTNTSTNNSSTNTDSTTTAPTESTSTVQNK